MLDLLMMALVVVAFAGATGYVGVCHHLGRRPDVAEEDRE
jgi:hypothetical protein